jgi:hypothetical protein
VSELERLRSALAIAHEQAADEGEAAERYRQALKPFAKALDDWGDEPGHPDSRTAWDHPIGMNVTLGDFRKARAALSPDGDDRE